jgi:signal transduction histidine kinase
VALPIIRRDQSAHQGTERPLPLFAQAAAQLGHVQVHLDGDGVVRSLYLQEGHQGGLWPHLSLAMQCAAGAPQPECRRPTSFHATGAWVRQQPRVIAFASTPFTTYSYIDVLRGMVPAGAFHDKYVLIGATASGLGDQLSAPAGPLARRLSSVEVVAHTLNDELRHIRIEPASPFANSLFNLVPVALALWALAVLGPSAALMGCVGLFALTLAAAGLAPVLWGVQLAPAAALAGLALAYPLWSWRRLNAAAHFLRLEMQGLQREGVAIAASGDDTGPGDFLERRIQAVERASRQLRDLHHFVSASLQQLPSPTFACDARGTVLLANAAAERYIGAASGALNGAPLPDLLRELVAHGSGQPLVTAQHLHMGDMPAQSEGRDRAGRSMLLLAKPFTATQASGWLMTLVDLTDMRQAQWQRDQAMHFISHDIRAPIGSILTLLEMQREYPGQMPQPELMARVERYAQASLALAENFVHLASAKYHAYHYAPIDLAALLEEAVDDAWAAAQGQRITIALAPAEEPAHCRGDRALLSRAVTNVLGNAIKYSPAGSTIRCAIVARPGHWVIAVRDQGPGIPAEQQSRLFEPFQRLHSHSHPSIAGAGLGLAFVHTVLERHGGAVELDSEEGHGTEFRLVLPRSPETDAAEHMP